MTHNVAPTLALAGAGDAMVVAALVVAATMVVTWVLSIVVKNASIVDIAWGLGFVVVGWAVLLTVGGGARSWLLTVLVTVWGLRLAGYLAWRNIGKGEDFRYRAMRKRWGAKFGLVSLVTVFGLQGVVMWVVSLPVQLGQVRTGDIGVVAVIGALVWGVGLAFETIGDAQLTRFKADPVNAGKVMDRGLWRYTRHPNYFGDAVVWWGLAVIAAESGIGAWGFIGAAVMTVFLRRVSGVTLLERSLVKRREGYVDYIARTSPFIPRPPRRN
jgi:steroid 5-alpha reductase family enzyme